MTAAIVKRTFQLAYGAREIRRTASIRTVKSFLMALMLVGSLGIIAMMLNRMVPDNPPYLNGAGSLPPFEILPPGAFDGGGDTRPDEPVRPEVEPQVAKKTVDVEDAQIITPVKDDVFEKIEDTVLDSEFDPHFDSEFDEYGLGNGNGFGDPDSPATTATTVVGGGNGNGKEISKPEPNIINDPNQFVAYDQEPIVDQKDLQSRVIFPHIAIVSELEGTVVVRALVDTDGSIRRVVVLTADNDVFIENAVAAVREIRVTPAMLGGSPVACWISIPISFRLR